MSDFATKDITDRELPPGIDYYEILEDGSVIESDSTNTKTYIEDGSVGYFSDPDAMLYIRNNYDKVIGVMRDTNYGVVPREYKTTKVLLCVVRNSTKEE